MGRILLLLLGLTLSGMPVWGKPVGEGGVESSLFVVGKSKEKFDQVFTAGKELGYFYYQDLTPRLLPLFRGIPYGASPVSCPSEKTLINFTSFDCVTFLETWWAVSRTLFEIQAGKIKPGADPFAIFGKNLNRIRYFGGENCGIEERIHYFTQAMEEMERQGLVFNVAMANGDPFNKKINFITTHASQYGDLANSSRTKSLESILSKSPRFFYKKENRENYYPLAQSGDLVAFATDEPGLDVAHVGVVSVEEGEVRVTHASSKFGKVVVGQSLENYARTRDGLTGFFIYRPRFE